ncbi:hypothetical protein [Pseudorhodoferax sp.]|uniref:hypothetical protein n=1 Tax=Pseudorhodoferax sp. TaxID=1993553 RepID=UPI0039E36861
MTAGALRGRQTPQSGKDAWAVTSGCVGGLWLFACAWCIGAELASDSSGWFDGLGYAVALLVALAGNAVSLLLHAGYWYFYGAATWFKGLVVCQALVVLGTVVWLAPAAWESHVEARRWERQAAVHAAIARDDVDALRTAWADCGDHCGSDGLLKAADARARRAAAFLVAQGLTAAAGHGAPQLSMHTCEGRYLPLLSALEVAVARDDAAMLQLLFPVSDETARRKALWTAAELDRLERLQELLARGVPIGIRGRMLDTDNDTLLVAAASGAALRVGRWLIDVHGMPVQPARTPSIVEIASPSPGTPPVLALSRYMLDVRDPARAGPFLQMLVAHGARVDIPMWPDTRTPLQHAVHLENKAMAGILLANGAREELLSPSERERLGALLAAPDRPAHDEAREGCVPDTVHGR